MIDLTIHEEAGTRRAARPRAQHHHPHLQADAQPGLIPDAIKTKLADVGLWDLNPLNLFRITWHNEPVASGGGFGGVNYLEFPARTHRRPARIVALVGKWFPTGAHKVGAAFGCLVPRLVTGQFDPTTRRRSGPRPATTAAAAPTTPTCWAATPSPSCPRA